MLEKEMLAHVQQFQQQGFLVLKQVLSKEKVKRLNQAIDEIIKHEPQSLSYNIYNSIERSQEIASLMDEPSILPLIVNILGFNIQLHISHLTIRHQNPTPEQAVGTQSFINWHQDGPHPKFPAMNGITPLYYVKTCYILSDLSQPDRGNTKVIPGSHRRPFQPEHVDVNAAVHDEVQITGEPGDVFVFGQNLWHAAAPNRSSITRRLLFLGYSYLWMKPIDYRAPSEQLLRAATPLQKQLLGCVDEDPFRNYVPKADELLLKALYLGHAKRGVYQ
jgi:ectoine hydroxylase-related dioxygenase (phytanoyl-CoA dioxygenase family)